MDERIILRRMVEAYRNIARRLLYQEAVDAFGKIPGIEEYALRKLEEELDYELEVLENVGRNN